MVLSLQDQILATLPPFVKSRDRDFQFDETGALVYDQEDGNWEPPREIDGFIGDSNNPWRLIPLWGVCEARMHTAIRFPACGCIGLVTRCTEPRAYFMGRVDFATCEQCRFNQKGSTNDV